LVILPDLHYGRDALVGIAIFLTLLAKKKISASELRDSYPKYTISKNKIQLTPEVNVDKVLLDMAKKYSQQEVDSTDGVKIYFEKEWVHLRKSNTEPIIRIYAESESGEKADLLANNIMTEIKNII
jgi:phosphomannomutase